MWLVDVSMTLVRWCSACTGGRSPRCRFAGGGLGTVRRPAGCVTPMTNSTDSRRPSWTELLREVPAAARLLAAQLHAHPRIRPV